MVETVGHPAIGPLRMLGIPFKSADTPGAARQAPPMLGQHTKEPLRNIGMSDDAISALREAGVV